MIANLPKYFLAISFSILSVSVSAQQPDDPLLSVVEQEMKRQWEGFKKQPQPPYYMSYRINDIQSASISSSFGSLTTSSDDHDRHLVIDVKVGDYNFDNSHPSRAGEDAGFRGQGRHPGMGVRLPLDDRKEAIQMRLWEYAEVAYRQAIEAFGALKNNPSASKETSPDFSREEASVHVDPPLPSFDGYYDRETWEKRIRKFTAPFQSNRNIVNSNASLETGLERKYFLSTEGSKIAQNRLYAFLSISAAARADDGDIVPLHLSYFAFSPNELPAEDVILRDVEAMIKRLELLCKAPVAEPYTGPAILHARAAGVFFHEIFGHRIEGHRLKNENDGQTFKGKIDQPVLLKTLSVASDPTMERFNGQPLNGFYRFDDEGVKAQQVKVVEDGVLKSFLMSRSPVDNFVKSNGHGRAQPGTPPVTRQSNLIIESKKPVKMADLRKMLVSECKKQKKEYGYLFLDVMGGFTTTDRFMPNAFNIFPTEVYRVYVDGRPDQLVRGVDLIGTPLAMFAGIAAADDAREVFTGFCGAESGSVPVTAIAPSLFVKRIETQKKSRTEIDHTLLERPQEGTKSVKE